MVSISIISQGLSSVIKADISVSVSVPDPGVQAQRFDLNTKQTVFYEMFSHFKRRFQRQLFIPPISAVFQDKCVFSCLFSELAWEYLGRGLLFYGTFCVCVSVYVRLHTPQIHQAFSTMTAFLSILQLLRL